MATAKTAESTGGKDAPPRMCLCGLWISAKDPHPLCISCLGVKHAQTAISNPDGCSNYSGFPTKTWKRRLRVAVAGNKDPCFSSQTQPREETAKQLLEPDSWGDIMDVESPDLLPLFSDALVGIAWKEDDEDEELSPCLLENDEEEEEEEDAILPPNLSRPSGNQSGDPPSPQRWN